MATRGNVDYSAKRHITHFSSGTWDKGVLVVGATGTAFSGAALEHASRICYVATTPSGLKPLGLCENKVVNYDLTRQKLNPFDPLEVQTGSKVTVIYHGWMDTNYVSGSPGALDTAYLASNG
jgi:hypothetical protein